MLGLMPVAIRGAAAAAAPVRFSSSVPRLLRDERAARSRHREKSLTVYKQRWIYIHGQFALRKAHVESSFLEIRENSIIAKDPRFYMYIREGKRKI